MNNISYIPDRINPRIDQALLTISLIQDKDGYIEIYDPDTYLELIREFEYFLNARGFTRPEGKGTNFYKDKIFVYNPRNRYATIVLYPDEQPINHIYKFFKYFRDKYDLSSTHNLISLELSYDLYPINNDYNVCENITNFLVKYIDLSKNFIYFIDPKTGDFEKKRDKAINGKIGYRIYRDKSSNCSIDPDKNKKSTFFKIYPKNLDEKWFVRIEVVFKRYDMSKFDISYKNEKFDNLRKFFDFVKKKPFKDIFRFSTVDYQQFIDKAHNYDFKERIYKFKRSKKYYITQLNELSSLQLDPNSTINSFYMIKKISKIMNLTSINNIVASFKESLSFNYINKEIAKLDQLS